MLKRFIKKAEKPKKDEYREGIIEGHIDNLTMQLLLESYKYEVSLTEEDMSLHKYFDQHWETFRASVKEKVISNNN